MESKNPPLFYYKIPGAFQRKTTPKCSPKISLHRALRSFCKRSCSWAWEAWQKQCMGVQICLVNRDLLSYWHDNTTYMNICIVYIYYIRIHIYIYWYLFILYLLRPFVLFSMVFPCLQNIFKIPHMKMSQCTTASSAGSPDTVGGNTLSWCFNECQWHEHDEVQNLLVGSTPLQTY